MRAKREIIGALELGSSEVKIIIAELVGTDLTVLGCGRAHCEGIVSGRVASISDTADAIIPAVADAEQMSGCEISDVLVCIGGRHISSQNNRGTIYHKKVSPASANDVATAIENAMHVKVPEGQVITNAVPRHYILDEIQGIHDPIRMSCMKLEAEVHLTLASSVIMDNIRRAVEKAGLRVREFVVSPLASSLAVLEEEEKDMGVMMINLGAGTTGIQVWRDGCLDWTGVLEVGGSRVTSAINRSLRTPVDLAERTKIEFGAVTADGVGPDEYISVHTVGGRAPCQISRMALIEDIIVPTVEEWLDAVFQFVSRSIDLKSLSGGIVLTGGAARMDGMVELVDAMFGIPARVGAPSTVKGLQSIVEGDASMSAAWGTVLYRALSAGAENGSMPMAPRSAKAQGGRGLGGIFKKAINLMV